MTEIDKILKENELRKKANKAVFNPITGEGSLGERFLLEIADFALPKMWLPVEMQDIPLIQMLQEKGSIDGVLSELSDGEFGDDERKAFVSQFVRLRFEHDFPFWAAFLVMIKQKSGGDDIPFWLNRAQRKLVAFLESKRKAGLPIRLVLLKARQWGGSTCIQIYMAWLQLVHSKGLNSLIVGHLNTSSIEVKDMFDRMLKAYPDEFLYELGEEYKEGAPKLVGVGSSTNIQRIPQRNCKIKIGSAESPDSARGGDYNLVHLTEVGLYKKTLGKTPENIVRAATSGITLTPLTMIVYESTANGTGNFFHEEYEAAKAGHSQFSALFVAWFEIEQYSAEIKDVKEFAKKLWEGRKSTSAKNKREESGRYLWSLWEKGATLEAIYWYILERAKYSDHALMAAEYPSDDLEAFTHSGEKVFDKYKVKELEKSCREPKWKGAIYADDLLGKEALSNIRFVEEESGEFWIWDKPEFFEEEKVLHRYLVVVDVGGRSEKSDYSVITVFDRFYMIDGDYPTVVAQWYGHTDMDILAWRAAQIATYYDNAFLVYESNTFDSKGKDRYREGHSLEFLIAEVKEHYDNLYARKQSEDDIREKRPVKYGFFTSVSNKPILIDTLQTVIRDRLYVERDVRCIEEYLVYEKKQNGAYGAMDGKHDDLLMTRAIGLRICFYEMPVPEFVSTQRYKMKKRVAHVASFS